MKHVGVLALSLFVAASLLLGCTFGNRQLQSITINQSVKGNQIQFTATGTYTAPPFIAVQIPASWGFGLFAPPPKSVTYTLTTQPFVYTCPSDSGPMLVVSVFAPKDPNAPMSGTVSWNDVVTASAQIQCP